MELTLQEAKEKYTSFVTRLLAAVPNACFIWCDFSGSGDSFDSFNNVEIQDSDSRWINTPEATTFASAAEDEIGFIWWKLIEGPLNSNFNNDGSRGDITINLKTGRVSADGEWYTSGTESSGSVEDEQLSEFFKEE